MRLVPLQPAVRIIQEEHDCMAAIINGMRHFTRRIEETGKAPDLKVFRAMLLYISDYPERIHHPKEDRYLFARLRQCSPKVASTLERLEVEHGQGEALVHGLEHALLRYELLGDSAFPEFARLVESYADFYFRHMNLEEDVVLPAAQESLDAQDWAEVNAAFEQNNDPLRGGSAARDYDRLFTLIATIAPAPVGVGPALE